MSYNIFPFSYACHSLLDHLHHNHFRERETDQGATATVWVTQFLAHTALISSFMTSLMPCQGPCFVHKWMVMVVDSVSASLTRNDFFFCKNLLGDDLTVPSFLQCPAYDKALSIGGDGDGGVVSGGDGDSA